MERGASQKQARLSSVNEVGVATATCIGLAGGLAKAHGWGDAASGLTIDWPGDAPGAYPADSFELGGLLISQPADHALFEQWVAGLEPSSDPVPQFVVGGVRCRHRLASTRPGVGKDEVGPVRRTSGGDSDWFAEVDRAWEREARVLRVPRSQPRPLAKDDRPVERTWGGLPRAGAAHIAQSSLQPGESRPGPPIRFSAR